MGKEVSLEDIEFLVNQYQEQAGVPIDFSSFPWLQERLSFFSRFLGFLGGSKRISWQKRYLLPVIVEVSVSHLRRYLDGKWKVYEESSLKKLFNFLGEHLGVCKDFLSFDLFSFLTRPAPSFSKLKEQLKIISKECMWKKEETYVGYKKRLQESVEKARERREAFSSRTILEESYRFTPLCKQTKDRLEAVLERLYAFREKCMEYSFQFEKDFAKVFPLRFDFEELVARLQKFNDAFFTLLLELENEIAKLFEMLSIADEESAKSYIEMSIVHFQQCRRSLQQIEQDLQDHCIQVEEARFCLQKKLKCFIRSIDHVLLLPLESLFKPKQAKVIRMARDKVKKFRDALGRGSGPGFSIVLLEQEVVFLITLAQQFYQEGMEVETMRAHLLYLEKRVKQAAEEQSGLKKNLLEEVFSEIHFLQESLEVAPDRKEHMEKINLFLSEIGILQQ